MGGQSPGSQSRGHMAAVGLTASAAVCSLGQGKTSQDNVARISDERSLRQTLTGDLQKVNIGCSGFRSGAPRGPQPQHQPILMLQSLVLN